MDKRCPGCGETKSPEQWPKNKSNKDGLGGYCKPCHNLRGRQSRERNGGARNYHLRRRYGITAAEAQVLFDTTPICPICGVQKTEHIDHDHETGKVRGVLCFNCNTGLGNFKDNKESLLRAYEYLQGIIRGGE